MTLRKGDRVAFKHQGAVLTGTVVKGGSKKIKVIRDGGKYEVTGPPECFRKFDLPLPKDPPSPMDKYEVISYKEINGHGDTPTFSCTITKDGIPIIQASNDGWGGSNMYYPIGNGSHQDVKAFVDAARAWAVQFGASNPIESEDLWIDWYENYKPYAVTAQKYWDEYNEMLNPKGGTTSN